jgi:hypothetical protein
MKTGNENRGQTGRPPISVCRKIGNVPSVPGFSIAAVDGNTHGVCELEAVHTVVRQGGEAFRLRFRSGEKCLGYRVALQKDIKRRLLGSGCPALGKREPWSMSFLSRTGERQSLVFENRDIRAMVKSPHALRISKAGRAGMAVT